jgi:ferredoxin-NADP reductase
MHKFDPTMHHTAPDPKNIVSYEVALKNKKQIAERTSAFIFEKPKGFHFKAGQHIRMTLINPSETDSEGDSRFFSMANTPQEKDLVFVMRMRDTAFKRVLGKMRTGEKVKIQMRLDNPHGSFTLHEDDSRPAVFLIGGIGIVPAYSMIKDAIERKLPHMIFLFYSNRRPEDAPYLNELEKMAKEHPSFILISTMTEAEKSVQSWKGETGQIDLPLIRKHVDDLKTPIFYIAGLSDMVSAMKAMLIKAGVNEDAIRAEQFTGFNLNEVHGMMNQSKSHNPSKSHIIFIVIGLAILLVVIGHAVAAVSLFKSGIDGSFIRNPIFLVMIILMLIIIPFKFKHISGFLHKKIE